MCIRDSFNGALQWPREFANLDVVLAFNNRNDVEVTRRTLEKSEQHEAAAPDRYEVVRKPALLEYTPQIDQCSFKRELIQFALEFKSIGTGCQILTLRSLNPHRGSRNRKCGDQLLTWPKVNRWTSSSAKRKRRFATRSGPG